MKQRGKQKLVVLGIVCVFLFSFAFSSLFIKNINSDSDSQPRSATTITLGEYSVPWGTNVYQNVPWSYDAWFYDADDYTFEFSNAKIQYEYVDDSSLNYEYTISDFNNHYTKGATSVDLVNGTKSSINNLDENDGNVAEFDSTLKQNVSNNNYSIRNGTLDSSGDLEEIDGDYTTINSTSSAGNYYLGNETFEDENISTSGNYYGSYSFENGYSSFIDSTTGNPSLSVIDKDSHNSVLHIEGNNDNEGIRHDFPETTSGEIEFWVYLDTTSYHKIRLMSTTAWSALIRPYPSSNHWRYYDGSSWNEIDVGGCSLNTWYQVNIDFDYSSHIFDLSVNGNTDTDLSTKSYSWTDGFEIITDSGDKINIDGYGMKQYDNYSIGDNLNPYGLPTNVSKFIDDYEVDYDTSVSVQSEEESLHKKYLKLEDNSDKNSVSAINTYNNQISGTIELYAKSSDVSQISYPIVLYGDSSAVFIRFDSGYLQYYSGGYQNGISVSDNVWYKIKISFDCNVDKYNVWFDGTKFADKNFINNVDYIDRTKVATYGSPSGYSLSVDSVDKNWTSGYYENRIEDTDHPATINLTTTISSDLLDNVVYSYKTDIPLSEKLKVSIYNFDTSSYYLLNSSNVNTFSFNHFGLSSAYHNGSNVRMKFNGADNEDEFQLMLEALKVKDVSYLDFYLDFDFSIKKILELRIDAEYKTNVSQTIDFSAYNFESGSYDLIDSGSYSILTLIQQNWQDSNANDHIQNNEKVRLKFYGKNIDQQFKLSIDYSNIEIYAQTRFEFDKTLKMLGGWKYRFVLDEGLGTEHTGSWMYFNLVDQPANFKAISESKYSTRWVLKGNKTVGTSDSIYHEDFSSNTWSLIETSSSWIEYQKTTPSDDAYVDQGYPDTNFGSDNDLQLYTDGAGFPEEQIFFHFNLPSKSSSKYFTDNLADSIYIYCKYSDSATYRVETADSTFDEDTITWNNKPSTTYHSYSTWDNIGNGVGWNQMTQAIPGYSEGHIYFKVFANSFPSYPEFYSNEYDGGSRSPYWSLRTAKKYHDASTDSVYYQTDTSELIGLKSPQGDDKHLKNGDVIKLDLKTDQDDAKIRLLNDGSVVDSLNALQSNTVYTRQDTEVFIDSEVTFDQIEVVSNLEDGEYLELFDVRAEKWYYSEDEEIETLYIPAYGSDTATMTVGEKQLKIYENDILRVNKSLALDYDETTEIFESTFDIQCFLSYYDQNNEHLDFNKFTTYINYTLNSQEFENERLTSNEFYVDQGSDIDFKVYDTFDSVIYQDTLGAESFLDIMLPVYQLKIKNERTNPISYALKNLNTTIDKSGSLFEGEILTKYVASNYYNFSYTEEGDTDTKHIEFQITDHTYFVVNRSQMCYVSLADQQGNFLNFENYRTFVNGTQIYQNVFYRDVGEDVKVEIKDRFGISIKNYTFTVQKEDNYLPITLVIHSLKVYNQQELYNFVNITRDPNYYSIHNYWSEWLVPNEICEFNLHSGHYRINLTNREDDTSSLYAYTLNADDIIIISSDNTITNMITDISNVNTTLGNQITNVEVTISNQNSEINNSIINLDIDLSNINSTLDNQLVDIDTEISNLNSNIDSLYSFTNTSFINLENNMNSSFISMENNIYSINQSISNLVIGVDNELGFVNTSIQSSITEVSNDLLIMDSKLDTNFFYMNTTLNSIGNNITDNYILINNTLNTLDSNINDSRLAIMNNLAYVNNSITNYISKVENSVYMINNSIYSAVVGMNTELRLINNSIQGNLSIMLSQNEFLTDIYNKTMFSDMLNWTGAATDYTKIAEQTDAYTFINNYRNQSVEIMLKYEDKIESLEVTAQNQLDQFLPKQNVSYRLKSVETGEYLNNWTEIENKTVDFGFYDENVPSVPDFTVHEFFLRVAVVVAVATAILAILAYGVYTYYQRTSNLKQNIAAKYQRDSVKFKKLFK